MFLDWLLQKSTAVIMCGDHGQPPPFIGAGPPYWLKGFVDYYEEINTDYRPSDTRKQKIEVEIPGQNERQTLVLNDIVLVDINAVEDALRADKSPWTLGYVTTIQSSQQQNNHCSSCNCIMRWQYSDKDPRQFTVDRKNNNLGHVRNNVMLTCLECNRRNGAS